MNRAIDIGVAYHPLLSTPIVVETTSDAIVISSDQKPPRKLAFDVRTGAQLAHLPDGYAPVQEASRAGSLRIAKGKKSAQDIELVDDSGAASPLATGASPKVFVADTLEGAVYAEPMAATPNVIGPTRDTERLVLLLVSASGAVLTLRLPWWVASSGRDARRLLPWRVEVCMRARVLLILSGDAYWISLEALESLFVEESAVTLRPLGDAWVPGKELTTFNTAPTRIARQIADDPLRELQALLGWKPGDVTRDGRTLILSEHAAESLLRSLTSR